VGTGRHLRQEPMGWSSAGSFCLLDTVRRDAASGCDVALAHGAYVSL
jgi:hypothetical protein